MKKHQRAKTYRPLTAFVSPPGTGRFGWLGIVERAQAAITPVVAAILCLGLGLVTQGCVGVGVETTYAKVIPNPVVSDHGLRASSATDATNLICTSAWLEEHHGKPKNVRRDRRERGDEIWTYRDGLLWNGITIFALVPVPLEVPTGAAGWTFVVRDGRVIQATHKSSHYTGGIVGFNAGVCGFRPFGAYSLNPESPSF